MAVGVRRLVAHRLRCVVHAEGEHLPAEPEAGAALLRVPLGAVSGARGLLLLHGVDAHRAVVGGGRDDRRLVRRPPHLEVPLLRRELAERLELAPDGAPADHPVVLAARQEQVRVHLVPRDPEDALRVARRLLEGEAAVPEVPHLHGRLPVVVVGDDELRRHLRVPGHAGAPLPGRRVLEADDLLLLLQVPDDGGPRVRAGAEDGRDLPVPGARQHLRTLVLARAGRVVVGRARRV
mmetsp:Transcript_12769/g.36155  ORF Transcript_12769/g.36155 Transcript_12769/m.36155 type:complete len:236 (+) Transcript_12769:834-1541(+)